jgi:subtilase family serine protease
MPGATFTDGWAQEESLDVQMVCVANPNAKIWVVEAKSDTNDDLVAAVDYAANVIKADVISMSWGADDTIDLLPYNKHFIDTTKCYCVASGDSNTVCWPSVLPNCISVGGTTLSYISGAPTPRAEYTWDGAGCGYSATMPQPNYQSGISTIQHTRRVTPDLSMIANLENGVYSVYSGAWSGVGGTSVATPLFSGILSIANQLRFNEKKGPLTTVYSLTPNMKTAANYVAPSNNVQTYLYTKIYTNPIQYANEFNDGIIGNDFGSSSTNPAGLQEFGEQDSVLQ